MKTPCLKLSVLALTLILATILASPIDAAAAPKKKPAAEPAPEGPVPWTLRDKYSFSTDSNSLEFCISNGDWRVLVDGVGTLVDDASFRISFADGTSLTSKDFGVGETDRGPFENEVGTGTHFWVVFPERNGLALRYNIRSHSDRPFLYLQMALENKGTTPLDITEISPAMIGPKGIHNMGPNGEVGLRQVRIRGGYPVYDTKSAPLAAIVHDPDKNVNISFGFLPLGDCDPAVNIAKALDSWQGNMTCSYSPAYRLMPGQTLETPPLWVSTRIATPSGMDQFYSWASSLRPQLPGTADAPRAWATADGGAGLAEVSKNAEQWKDSGVKAALIPREWEGRPGSLQGGAPRYPKDISKAANDLRGLGVKAGLTVDPLSIAGGSGEFAAATPDGRGWVNLAAQAGRAFAAERLKKDVAGFDFYVVAPSDIPEEVLKSFGISRAQADALAFAVMSEASGGKPVLPSTATTLGAGLEEWLDAAAACSRMAEFKVLAGPVRFDGATELSDDTLAAMMLFTGPIEFAGGASAKVKAQVADVLAQGGVAGRPLDMARKAPKAWQIHVPVAEGKEALSDAIVLFPGAKPLETAKVEREAGVESVLWNAENGAHVAPEAKSITCSDKLTMYGLTRIMDRPTLMGASGDLRLMLDDLTGLTWKEEKGKGVLAGTFKGNNSDSTAYVSVPAGWKVKSAQVGGQNLRAKDGQNLVAFPVKAGASTPFELEFDRQ